MTRNLMVTSSVLALGLCWGTAAFAQQGEGVEAVTVTGSRIARQGYEAPTPLTVTSADLLAAANPGGPADALVQMMPVLSASTQPRGSTGSGGSGGTFLNLRNLGANNTLVLLNGERFVSSTAAGSVDISLIPTALIQRVEVVTGGASAAYGSDAVTGVVNFILDDKFVGLKGSGQAGLSQQGGDFESKFTLAAGMNFGGDHGHVMFGAEMYHSDGIYSLISTPLGKKSCQTITLPPGSATGQGFACDVRSSQANFGGIISGSKLKSGAASTLLKGTTFDNNGNAIPFNYGSLVTSTTMVGGDGIKPQFLPGSEPIAREVVYGQASWDFNNNLSVYATLDYGVSNYDYQIGSYNQNLGATALTISADNAYLPSELANYMAGHNIANFTLNKYFADLPRTWIKHDNNVLRMVVGAKGRIFGDWDWNVHFENGQTDESVTALYDQILGNTALAADAVVDPNSGHIVCRSTLTTNNGCVPFNMLGNSGIAAPYKGQGVNTATEGQLNYLTGTDWRKTRIVEDNFAANINGTPFSIWAGDVSVAAGFEWRYELMGQRVAPEGLALNPITGVNGPFRVGNYFPQAGNYNVSEGYFETVVPLLHDVPLAKNVEFNGAVRLTNYSTSGTAFTWKAGVTWDVSDEFRLRGTRSRDARAPNLTELFAAVNGGHGSIIDYGITLPDGTHPVNAQAQNYSQGNPDLKPEYANTTTAGIVYQAEWLPGLMASADWYSININGNIGSIGSQLIVQQCAQGVAAECKFVLRNTDGSLFGTVTAPQNLVAAQTEGADFEANYSFALNDVWDELEGNMTVHGIANYVSLYTQETPGAAVINFAGDNSHPQWRWTMQTQYSKGPFSTFIQARYSGAGSFTKTLTTDQLPYMHVGGQILIDLNLNYDIPVKNGVMGIFLNVTDLFNDIEPVWAGGGGQNGYGSNQYDPLGRFMRAGVRFNF